VNEDDKKVARQKYVDNGMKVVQKYVDMAKYLYVVLRNFPRAEKYAMAVEIRHALIEAGSLLNRAGDIPSRSGKLILVEKADERIGDLKFMVRFCMELGEEYVPFEKYRNFSLMVTEVGRMLGGWLKNLRAS
jgi:hypothetical protein